MSRYRPIGVSRGGNADSPGAALQWPDHADARTAHRGTIMLLGDCPLTHPDAGILRRNLLLDPAGGGMAGCWVTSARPRSHRAEAIALESRDATVPDGLPGITLIA